MPITKELENLRKFESVGFTHEQAEILTDVIEQSHVDSQHTLKDSFHTLGSRMDTLENRMDTIENRMDALENRMDALENRMDAFENRMGTLEKKIDSILKVTDNFDLHIKAGQTDLLLKIFAITAACASIAVAASKLL